MPRYIIERGIPGAGKLTPAELSAISRNSCAVIAELGPTIQWVQSYVTHDRIYCTYLAPNEEILREHARRGGFPADRITEVRSVIDPTTAER
ncbi:MAG: DUF4242 domain-containing protein [Dehalococcoidia bacterium]